MSTSKPPARPRIAIDDGSALLRATFKDDGTAALSTVAHSQVVAFAATGPGPRTSRTILIRPSAIAVDSTNHYFVVDQGVEEDDSGSEALRFPALWRVSSTGEVPTASATPLPLPPTDRRGRAVPDGHGRRGRQLRSVQRDQRGAGHLDQLAALDSGSPGAAQL